MKQTYTPLLFIALLATPIVSCGGSIQPAENASEASTADPSATRTAPSAQGADVMNREAAGNQHARAQAHEQITSSSQTEAVAAEQAESGAEQTLAAPADDTAAETEPEPIQTLEGRATYYAASFAGKVTKSGETYEPTKLTAATKRNGPPLGSVVRVVRKDTDAVVTVRVNDRLPQRMGATIDLSRAAAEELDMIEEGIVPVRVEVLSLSSDEDDGAQP